MVPWNVVSSSLLPLAKRTTNDTATPNRMPKSNYRPWSTTRSDPGFPERTSLPVVNDERVETFHGASPYPPHDLDLMYRYTSMKVWVVYCESLAAPRYSPFPDVRSASLSMSSVNTQSPTPAISVRDFSASTSSTSDYTKIYF
jgi:hypothetical protein